MLISQGIAFTQAGDRYMVRCPFHDDKNPSAGVWKDNGYFKCFACGKTVSFIEYISEVSPDVPAELLRSSKNKEAISGMEERLQALLASDKPTEYFNIASFHSVYPSVEEGSREWQYIGGRGIDYKMVSLFDMRAGRQQYEGRLILPIYTADGRLLSYTGVAVMSGVVPKTRKSRSPHKTLFGLYELVKGSPRIRYEYVVVVEGEFDAIYLQQYGIPAVANMGTVELTIEKIRLLRRYAKRVVLSYDGDMAGRARVYGTGGRKSQLEMLKKYVPTMAINLPDGCDPNMLTGKQVEEFYGKYCRSDVA